MHTVRIHRRLRVVSLYLLTVVYMAMGSIAPLSAITYQVGEPEEKTNREKAHLNITFTGGGALEDCPPFTVGETSSEVLTGDSNAEKLYRFLRAKGLSPEQAAGIIGNVMQESGGGTFNISPDALNPSSGAYGIIQWYAGRKTKLLAYADRVGKPKNDLGMQMDFMWLELNGAYKHSVLNPIKASSGRVEPTKIWLERYEIPCLPGSAECAAELQHRMTFTDRAYEAFSGIQVDSSSTSSGGNECETGDSGTDGTVDANGYAFPVVLPRNQISNGYSWPCKTTPSYCHHDGTPGMDISKVPNTDSSAGVSVVAIHDGKIESINQNYSGTTCQSFQFKSTDGYYYWYGHVRTSSKTPKVGVNVKAGTFLAKIGERRCTGNGSYPHLHIDRGFPKGYTGGEDSHRDPNFIPLMNELYRNLN